MTKKQTDLKQQIVNKLFPLEPNAVTRSDIMMKIDELLGIECNFNSVLQLSNSNDFNEIIAFINQALNSEREGVYIKVEDYDKLEEINEYLIKKFANYQYTLDDLRDKLDNHEIEETIEPLDGQEEIVDLKEHIKVLEQELQEKRRVSVDELKYSLLEEELSKQKEENQNLNDELIKLTNELFAQRQCDEVAENQSIIEQQEKKISQNTNASAKVSESELDNDEFMESIAHILRISPDQHNFKQQVLSYLELSFEMQESGSFINSEQYQELMSKSDNECNSEDLLRQKEEEIDSLDILLKEITEKCTELECSNEYLAEESKEEALELSNNKYAIDKLQNALFQKEEMINGFLTEEGLNGGDIARNESQISEEVIQELEEEINQLFWQATNESNELEELESGLQHAKESISKILLENMECKQIIKTIQQLLCDCDKNEICNKLLMMERQISALQDITEEEKYEISNSAEEMLEFQTQICKILELNPSTQGGQIVETITKMKYKILSNKEKTKFSQTQFNDKMAEMTNKITELEEEIENFRTNDIENKCAELLMFKNQTIEYQSNEINETKMINEDYYSELLVLNNNSNLKMDSYEYEINVKNDIELELEMRLQTLRSQNQELQQLNEKKFNEYNQVLYKFNALVKSNKQMELLNTQQSEQIAKLQNSVDEKDNQLIDSKKYISQHNIDMQLIRQNIAKLKSELALQEHDLSKPCDQLRALAGRLKSVGKKVKQIAEERASVKAQLAELRSDSARNKKAVSQYEAQVELLKDQQLKQAQSQRAQAEGYEREIRALQSVRISSDGLRRQLDQEISVNAQQDDKIQMLSAQLSQLDQTMNSTIEVYQMTIQENKEYKGMAEKLTQEVAAFSQEFKRFHAESNESIHRAFSSINTKFNTIGYEIYEISKSSLFFEEQFCSPEESENEFDLLAELQKISAQENSSDARPEEDRTEAVEDSNNATQNCTSGALELQECRQGVSGTLGCNVQHIGNQRGDAMAELKSMIYCSRIEYNNQLEAEKTNSDYFELLTMSQEGEILELLRLGLDYERELFKINQELEEEINRNKQLKEEKLEMANQILELENEVMLKEEQLSQGSNQSEQRSNANDFLCLQKLLNEKELELMQLRAKNEASEERCNSLRSTYEHLVSEKESSELVIKQEQETITSMNDSIISLQTDNTELSAHQERLSQQAIECRTLLSGAVATLKQMLEQCSCSEAVDRLSRIAIKMEQIRGEAKNHLNGSKGGTRTAQEIVLLQSQLAESRQSLASKDAELALKTQENAELQSCLEEEQQSSQGLKEYNTNLELNVLDLQEELYRHYETQKAIDDGQRNHSRLLHVRCSQLSELAEEQDAQLAGAGSMAACLLDAYKELDPLFQDWLATCNNVIIKQGQKLKLLGEKNRIQLLEIRKMKRKQARLAEEQAAEEIERQETDIEAELAAYESGCTVQQLNDEVFQLNRQLFQAAEQSMGQLAQISQHRDICEVEQAELLLLRTRCAMLEREMEMHAVVHERAVADVESVRGQLHAFFQAVRQRLEAARSALQCCEGERALSAAASLVCRLCTSGLREAAEAVAQISGIQAACVETVERRTALLVQRFDAFSVLEGERLKALPATYLDALWLSECDQQRRQLVAVLQQRMATKDLQIRHLQQQVMLVQARLLRCSCKAPYSGPVNEQRPSNGGRTSSVPCE